MCTLSQNGYGAAELTKGGNRGANMATSSEDQLANTSDHPATNLTSSLKHPAAALTVCSSASSVGTRVAPGTASRGDVIILGCTHGLEMLRQRPRGPMDKASAYGAGDCRFESCRGHLCCSSTCNVDTPVSSNFLRPSAMLGPCYE